MSVLNNPSRAIDGSLEIGGLPTSELAASYDTPLIIIDTAQFDATIADIDATAASLGVEVAYAGKALLVVALAQRLRSTRLYLDCCSLGELLTAEVAGFPAERIYLHGCGKTQDELQAVVDGRVGRIIVDGFDELGRLAAMSRIERPVSVVLRFNTAIEAHTHEFIRTGGENTKFGFALEEADEAFAWVEREPALKLVGLHAHIGSQVIDPYPFIANLEILMQLYERAHERGNTTLTGIIVGGGFGVPMHPDETADRLDFHATLSKIAERSRELAREANVPIPHIGIEPGRSLIGEAGTTVYRVVALKRHGRRRFVIIDGGMTDNPRPALYQAYHHPQLASRVSQADSELMTICGRACENDQLVEAELPGDIHVGDLLAIRVTGAYTFSMASNYNRFPRPALVFAGEGRHMLAVRRETSQELLRNDLTAG
jgi:diaminopimelate decarboxylase